MWQNGTANRKKVEILQGIVNSRIESLNELKDLSCKPVQKIKSPPLDLHSGHIGLLLANGCLDGVVGTGINKHIVRGKVEKYTVSVEECKNKVVETREMEKYRISIKLLTQDGEIREII